MATAAELEKFINGKFMVLAFMSDDNGRIMEQGDVKAMGRQADALENIIDKIHESKLQLQTVKIESDGDPTEVRKWTEELQAKLCKYEDEVKALKKEITGIVAKEEESIEEEKRKRLFDQEIKLQEAKLQRQFELEQQHKAENAKSAPNAALSGRAKLPKLVITPFQGTHLDWMRFWSQFETEIDKTEVSAITKFSYLKELLVPNVRVYIDGLPFTTEGYERAKNVLKTKYGKPSEVANAHMRVIMSLPSITGSSASKIHEFYEKLISSVHALETMKKLKEINGYVRLTLDKLPAIRADLVRLDDNWQEWEFHHLVEAIRKWCERNPVSAVEHKAASFSIEQNSARKSNQRRERVYQTREGSSKVSSCVYCEGEHKPVDCDRVKNVTERKKLLAMKKLCFNCTGAKHRAAECRSKYSCQKCEGKHHTSICDHEPTPQRMMLATGEGTVIYPVVVVLVEGIQCRALLDTGAGSSYASAALIQRINKHPVRTEHKRIDMMMCSTTQRISVYDLTVRGVDGKFELKTTVNKVDKGVLLTIPNPRYAEIIQKYDHLNGVVIEDNDTKSELPIHMILGASEYSRIKTNEKPKVGHPGEPVAEHTALGWTMMSPGKETQLGKAFVTRSSAADYAQLCNLDVLGLEDKPAGDQQIIYDEFVEQLDQTEQGWYETGLLWKPGHKPLPTNEHGSIKRLGSLLRRLQSKPELLDKYDDIIQEQLAEGIVERVEEGPTEREFYIPHKPVVRETAETTKVRIVFDASAKANEDGPSLNECLETGPPIQNLLWDVLVRNRVKPIALAGDIKQAFLQVRIRPEHRDALRFHWIKNKDPSAIEVLRFTRALFGLVQSPFLLAGTLKVHLDKLKKQYPVEVEEIQRSMYVDDMITGGSVKDEVLNLKKTAVAVFEAAKFTLHKWHSNEPQLESEEERKDEQPSYAKQQLGVNQGETKMLGLPWDKNKDTLAVTFPEKPVEVTKREVLRFLASVYDPLGLVSPVTLVGKLLYRDVCERHLPWDEKLSDNLALQWHQFMSSLPNKVDVTRALPSFKEPIQEITLHVFGDASGSGVSAAVYGVIHQVSGISQGLVAASSRLAKKNLTIPRLELVSAHMAANLVDNVRKALEGYPVTQVQGWLDSTVALYWIKRGGRYKQFVANRVLKINEKEFIEWRHVGTDQNPADLGSRGCKADQLPDVWFEGPNWLADVKNWPENIVPGPTKETDEESKKIQEVFAAAVEVNDDFTGIMEKHAFWRAVRITSWISRFIQNCRKKKSNRLAGPLSTTEIEKQVKWWIRREQQIYSATEKFQEDKLRLNLQKNEEGIYECRGRIQGDYPAYLPPRTTLSEKIIQDAHWCTLHGGVGLTMAYVRKTYWIPKLRYLTRKVVRQCYGCKRFHATAFNSPPPGNLPTDRTEGSTPFQATGVDYAGPIQYKATSKREGKAYILLFTCSLTRAVHIELMPDLTTGGFITALKRFIARRGRPQKIYSDNASTFVGAEKWLRSVMRDESLQNYLAHQSIVWQFNLSRAPWWGGQFERLVGIVKQALYKSVGRAILTWNELEEVMLDVEVAINNRPLSYVEDDVQLPLLTPNVMLYDQPNLIPEPEADAVDDTDLRKRARYLRRCKDVLWSRWTDEYLRSLRERHNLNHKTKQLNLKIGDVVLIKGDERNRGKWNLGIVQRLIPGRDGVVRAVKLRAGKSYLERAPQHLYPMELSCDRQPERPLNPTAREFHPRAAAQTARQRITEIAQEEIQVV